MEFEAGGDEIRAVGEPVRETQAARGADRGIHATGRATGHLPVVNAHLRGAQPAGEPRLGVSQKIRRNIRKAADQNRGGPA